MIRNILSNRKMALLSALLVAGTPIATAQAQSQSLPTSIQCQCPRVTGKSLYLTRIEERPGTDVSGPVQVYTAAGSYEKFPQGSGTFALECSLTTFHEPSFVYHSCKPTLDGRQGATQDTQWPAPDTTNNVCTFVGRTLSGAGAMVGRCTPS